MSRERRCPGKNLCNWLVLKDAMLGYASAESDLYVYYNTCEHNIFQFLGGLRVTNPTIRLACLSVCPSAFRL